MHSVTIFSVLAAVGAGLVRADTTCTQDITITQPTPVINCDVVDANIKVDPTLAGNLVISGPQQLKGDLIVNNATQLLSISSTSINAIGGRFELESLELLSTLSMSSLRTLNDISFIKLPQLSSLTFGSTGVTKASKVIVSDTFLGDLSGLNLATVDFLQIDNNHKLTAFNSDLVNVTDSIIINNNGNEMVINMTQLETAAEIQLSNIKSFDAPALNMVTASIKFDSNPELKSFSADNLTQIAESLTFINNIKLANISFPKLTKINGDLTVINNTDLIDFEGFGKLKTVYGGVQLGGGFEKVELPALNDVKGTVKVSSTTDISDFCKFFDDAKSNGDIQGEEKCTSNNSKANTGDTSGGTSGGSGDKKDDSAAGMTSVNMAMLALAAVAAVAQLM